MTKQTVTKLCRLATTDRLRKGESNEGDEGHRAGKVRSEMEMKKEAVGWNELKNLSGKHDLVTLIRCHWRLVW